MSNRRGDLSCLTLEYEENKAMKSWKCHNCGGMNVYYRKTCRVCRENKLSNIQVVLVGYGLEPVIFTDEK